MVNMQNLFSKGGRVNKKNQGFFNFPLGNRRGIVFTIDAIIAVIILIAFVSASYFYLKNINNNFGDNDLFQVSQDSLTVLELNNELQSAIATSSISDIQVYIDNLLPSHVCADIALYDSSDILQLNATKTNCTSSDETSSSIRTFIVSNNFYYAKMRSWYD